MLVVATYATQRYAYALPNFGRRFASCLYHSNQKKGKFIFVADGSDIIKEQSYKYIASLLPDGWEFIYQPLYALKDSNLRNYKEDAQLLICQMQSHAFTLARKLNASLFWSLESDVLIPTNALTVSKDILNFDNSYYDVVMCTYPSQGGGAFLGGGGTYKKHIEDDFLYEERLIPPALAERKKKNDKVKHKDRDEKWWEENKEIYDHIKRCPPKNNVYTLNGKKWRKRGWLDYHYPAMGKGCIMPTDWVGLGCTMMSKKALSLAHFDGYLGKGTQDLHIVWNCWKPNDINLCVTSHAICDHIIRERDGEDQLWDKFTHVQAYHEPEGEFKGHLRQSYIPFYNHIAGEKAIEEDINKAQESAES